MNPWVIIPFAILLAAFFSAMELAFIASNKLRIELDRKQGNFGSGIFSMLAADLIESWLKNLLPGDPGLPLQGSFRS